MLPGVLIRRARPADVPGIITLFAAVAEELDSIGTEPGFDIAKRQSSILKSIDEAVATHPISGSAAGTGAVQGWGCSRWAF
jgi:hypothetical protein